MTAEPTIESQIASIYRALRAKSGENYKIEVSEKDGKVTIGTNYDMLLNPFKSEIENQKLTFPRSALESLLRGANELGVAQVTI